MLAASTSPAEDIQAIAYAHPHTRQENMSNAGAAVATSGGLYNCSVRLLLYKKHSTNHRLRDKRCITIDILPRGSWHLAHGNGKEHEAQNEAKAKPTTYLLLRYRMARLRSRPTKGKRTYICNFCPGLYQIEARAKVANVCPLAFRWPSK